MCTNPSSTCPPAIAHERIRIFQQMKKSSLDDAISYDLELPFVKFNAHAFLDLLQKIAAPYDGVRVYFATHKKHPVDPGPIPPGLEDHLTLIFVLTKDNGPDPDGGRIHEDQLSFCYFLDNIHSTAKKADASVGSADRWVRRWIRHYKFSRIPFLEDDAAVTMGLTKFKETHCIWYGVEIIKPSDGSVGLLDYVTCMIGEGMTEVTVFFAGYRPMDKDSTGTYSLNYQLTLIFEFNNGRKGERTFYSFSFADMHEEDKKKFYTRALTQTDTGNPCPPPNTGCKGAKL